MWSLNADAIAAHLVTYGALGLATTMTPLGSDSVESGGEAKTKH